MHVMQCIVLVVSPFLFRINAVFLSNELLVKDQEKVLKEAVGIIIEKAYREQIVFITALTLDDSTHFRVSNILQDVLAKIDCSTLYLELNEAIKTETLRFYNIIFLDSYEAFLNHVGRLKDPNIYDATGYYTIVLMIDNSDLYLFVQKILQICWTILIVNVNILVEPLKDLGILYSYYPYTPLHCGNFTPVIINKFVNGVMISEEIFPRKFNNLYNCTLRVITWENPPFIIIPENSSSSRRLDGIEGNILENIAEVLNFSIRLVAPPEENPRGYIFENGTSTGSFGMLSRAEADLTIGCYRYSEQRVKNFGSTHPYYQVPLIIAMTRGASYTSMERLFYPFHTIIWVLMAILFLIAYLIFIVLKACFSRKTEHFVLGHNNTMPLYNMWVSSFGGQTNHSPKHNFARFLLLLWISVTLVIRSSYQGALYDFIRTNAEKEELNTLADLADAGVAVHVDPPTIEIVADIEHLRKIYVESAESQHVFLHKLQQGMPKTGILVPRDYVAYFNIVNHKNGTLHILKERVVVQPVAIFFQRSSFLTDPFKQCLWIYSRSGLLDKWVDDFMDMKYSKPTSKAFPNQLNNYHFAGAYIIYIVFISFACLLFILELLTARLKYFENCLE